MRRVLFAFTGIAAAVFIMAIGGVDNVARSQSSLPAPTGVSAVNGNNHGEVVVSWQAVAETAYYRIGWMADEDYQAALLESNQEWTKEFRYSNVLNRGQTSRTVTRLTPGIQYWIIVGSHHAFDGAPQWSNWQQLTLTAAPTPTRPDGGSGGPVPEPQPTNSVPFDGSRLSSISSGRFHTCGVRQVGGTVHCFGSNGLGQSSPPAGEFLFVSAGGGHTCGIKADSTVLCWGGTAVESPPPNQSFVQIATGDNHVCGLTPQNESANAEVVCWGAPGQGRTDDLSDIREPRDRFYNIESITVGSNHNCMVADYQHGTGNRLYKRIRCWGSNESGQHASASPVTKASAGQAHTCWINQRGTIACRGSNVSGQGTPPVPAEGAFDQNGFTYTDLTAGGAHTCAINGDGNAAQAKGTVRCWGSNLDGQSSESSGIFDSISAGKSHTCALRQNGTISCWGDNSYGQAPR